ncbi:MAG TPA: hypothetical protein VF980_09025 [Thermoanaerobaculia bacterium]
MRRAVISFLLFVLPFASAAAPWTTLGPLNGTILRIAAASRDIVYVAAPDGVFRTRDGGTSWTNVTGPLVMPSGVVVDAAAPDVVIASASNGVFRSEDGGATWETASALPADPNPGNLVIDPRDANTIYAVGDRCRGLLKSIDNGRTFAEQTSDGRGTNEVCTESIILDPLDPDRLYKPWIFSDVWGADRSDDGGRTWVSLSFADSPRRGSIAAVGGQRYAIGTSRYDQLLTGADGVTWTRVPITGITPPPIRALEFFDLVADSASGRLFLATDNGVFRSDNGTDWIQLAGTAGEAVRTIHFDAESATLTIGTDFGLLRSTGSPWNTWTLLNVGNSAMPMNELIADPSSGDMYARSRQHVFAGRNLGTTWQVIGDPLPTEFASIIIGAGHDLYSRYQDREGLNYVQRLEPDGHWTTILTTLALGPVAADPGTPGTLYAALGNVLQRTRDGGRTWEQLVPPAPVGSLAIDPRDSNVLAATAPGGVLKSTDAGATWSFAPTPLFKMMFSIAFAPSDPNVLYALGPVDFQPAPTVLGRSTDGGRTWLPQPAPGESVLAFTIDPHDANRIFLASADRNVARSEDGGRTWQSIRSGLPEGLIRAIAVDSAGAFVHVGTETRGVWELPLAARRRAVRIR